MDIIKAINGNITIIDSLSGKTTIITQSEIEDFKCEKQDGYTKEWREATRATLSTFGLSNMSICLMINGRFDHNKHALKQHLKRVDKLDYLERIWSLL